MTEAGEKNPEAILDNLLSTINGLQEGQRLQTDAIMQINARLVKLERAQAKPKSKLIGLSGHPMNG